MTSGTLGDTCRCLSLYGTPTSLHADTTPGIKGRGRHALLTCGSCARTEGPTRREGVLPEAGTASFYPSIDQTHDEAVVRVKSRTRRRCCWLPDGIIDSGPGGNGNLFPYTSLISPVGTRPPAQRGAGCGNYYAATRRHGVLARGQTELQSAGWCLSNETG